MKARTGALGLVAALTCAATFAATAVMAAPVRPRLEGQGNIAPMAGSVALNHSSVMTPTVERAVDRSVRTHRLGPPVSLRTVLSDSVTAKVQRPTGGVLRWKSQCGHYDDVLKPLDKKKRVSGWCWDTSDQIDISWVPQGVASTAEAAASGRVEGERAMAVSWYRRTRTDKASRGTRISLFRTPASGTSVHYNHVALVTPTVRADGFVDFTDVKLHAGGLAWSGPYLFVPQTDRGVRVFDTREIYRVGTGTRTGASSAGGIRTSVDARFAMLEVARFTTTTKGCAQRAPLPLCFSTLSIDRSTSPPRLIAAEHLDQSTYKRLGRGASVVAWDLGPDGLPAFDGGESAIASSDRTLAGFTHSLQGAYVSTATNEIYTSSSTIDNGWLWYERDGDGRVPRKTKEWPAGAQSLSRWYGTGKLISLSERVHRRMLFTVYACELRGGNSRCT